MREKKKPIGRPRSVPHVPGWDRCRCAECRQKSGERPSKLKLSAQRQLDPPGGYVPHAEDLHS